MRIAILTSEAAPFASTGGLGEVVSSLSNELTAAGHEVMVMMPHYAKIRVRPTGFMSPLRMLFGARQITYSILEAEHKGVKFVFIDYTPYFSREGIYGDDRGEYKDNDERFIFFTRACLDYYERKESRPDIFHANDWPTALTSLFLKTHYQHEVLAETPVLFTIHDAEYQGIFSKDRFHLLNVGWEYFTSEGIEFYDSINFLKAGVLYSDVLTTVSRKYAEEIQTPEYGYRLDGLFRSRRDRLHGILNGIDDNVWNPATDPNIAANYSASDPAGKLVCRRALLKELGWDPESPLPIIAAVTRLAAEKGLDLLESAAERLAKIDAHFVVLGSGAARYEGFLQKWAEENPGRVSVTLRFDQDFSRRIQAGADMFLMPSRHEPCGLNQMYSLRYGTIPIVRSTGGLDDSVQEWNAAKQTGNGFKFVEYTTDDMLEAIRRGVVSFQDQSQWQRMVLNALSGDYSWRAAAQQYLELYKQAAGLKS